jgi:hypothetical protein
MPNNELEIHPYLESINDFDYDVTFFENLIIGSFPIYSITDTLYEDGSRVSRFNYQDAFMRFFYGSKKNSFWELFSNAIGTNNPIELEENNRTQSAISILVENNFLITDVIHKTNRNHIKSEDSELWVTTSNDFVRDNRTLNWDIERVLNRNINIKYIYFTSTEINGNSPFGWFKIIFRNNYSFTVLNQIGNRIISASIVINNRKYIIFFLPSPAGKGTRGLQFSDTRRTEIFVNYIRSIDFQFFEEINNLPQNERTQFHKSRLSQLRKNFLLESWRQSIVLKNIEFNGSV